ncbi:hypothetical protein ACFXMT_46210 [Streptomyces mirabilis]|uniref:hypothetical protein n=1 Tax=Streptomyces mirabilis TaxID=68239 RepID=UPI00365D91C7
MYGYVSERRSPVRGQGQHVLVVADGPEITELLSTTLELAGYHVKIAADGAELTARTGSVSICGWGSPRRLSTRRLVRSCWPTARDCRTTV